LVFVALPAEPLARDARSSIDDLRPLLERTVKLLLDRFVDQLVDDPLDLVALEHKHNFVRRHVDAVVNDAGMREIKRRAGLDQIGGTLLTSFLQVGDDRYAFHPAPLLTATVAAPLL
jgi:hypothetical protein